MSAVTPKPIVHYPDSDGKPMSDNTLQFDWISLLKWNAEAYYRDRPDVFVAGDHLIYPVEGNNRLRQAPDVYVAFGRPKGYRGSYMVWEEGDVFPQVLFEVWSPNNRYVQMRRKFNFYDRFGAEEYYIVYPEFPGHLEGWVRTGGRLHPVAKMNGHVSPRVGCRFEQTRGVVRVYGSDGREWLTPDQIARQRDEALAAAEQARTAVEQIQAAEDKLARLAVKLRELGGDPDAV